jgi:hypothetical protein
MRGSSGMARGWSTQREAQVRLQPRLAAVALGHVLWRLLRCSDLANTGAILEADRFAAK